MDDQRNTGEFDLEDILKEFGDTEPQPEEDILIWGEEPKNKPAPAMPRDTVRLDQITKAVRQQEADLDQTVAFAPVSDLEQTIAVGDGANDLPMLSIAGLGVAFRAKPLVKQSAKQAISTLGLDGILYLLGFRDREGF